MTSTIQSEIQKVVDKIVQEFHPEKVILFGSYANGTPHLDSDVDLFVVKDTNLPSLQRIEVLDRLFPRRPFAMDFLVYTPTQVRERVEMGDIFVQDVVKNGKVLYEHAG